MGDQCWCRRFPVAVTGILPETAHSKFWRRKGLTIRACTEKLWMRAGTRSCPTRMPTCRSHAEENLFPRRCIISCGSPERMECTPDICPAIPRRTAVSACRNSMQLRFSTQSASALRSPCLAGHQREAMRDNGNPRLCGAAIDLQTRASTRGLRRLHRLGGDKLTLITDGGRIVCAPKPTAAVATPLKKDERQALSN